MVFVRYPFGIPSKRYRERIGKILVILGCTVGIYFLAIHFVCSSLHLSCLPFFSRFTCVCAFFVVPSDICLGFNSAHIATRKANSPVATFARCSTLCGLRPRIERHSCTFEGTSRKIAGPSSKLRSLNAAHLQMIFL